MNSDDTDVRQLNLNRRQAEARTSFALRAGAILDDIVREADELNLTLLAQFVMMARIEVDSLMARNSKAE